MSRAYTEEEVRKMFIKHLRKMANYWEKQGKDTADALDGFIFSILCLFDGGTMDMPAMDIVLRPHPSDKKFHIKNNENYFNNGMIINDCIMHEKYKL